MTTSTFCFSLHREMCGSFGHYVNFFIFLREEIPPLAPPANNATAVRKLGCGFLLPSTVTKGSVLHHFQSCLDSPPHSLVSSSLSSSPLSSSITPSLFHSRLKTYLFNKSFPCTLILTSPTAGLPSRITIMGLNRTYHASRFIFSSFFFNFCLSRVVD